MKCCWEWKAQQDIPVIPRNFFTTRVPAPDGIGQAAAGWDEFQVAGLIKAGHRLAGCGRNNVCRREDRAARPGPGAMEAAPSAWVACQSKPSALLFKITTDIILDPGLLASCLWLDVGQENEPPIHIRLNQPAVRLNWPSRGTVVVSIDKL
ncbi:hypothetical protein [Sporomusa termitida]|uniref:Uncharacterized protein n=1 Tax=Sporomusa termitida TaxID=2377 RepID=A0A517DR73_9FIRM|nr:hypothetical protein [Sporomusa termitida]QDR79827.1 hypothetical protein SPTER_11290 [Sporomusa termitida]